MRKFLIALPVLLLALVTAFGVKAQEKADPMLRDIWHSHLLICADFKEITGSGCSTFGHNQGPVSYTACVEQGLSFKAYMEGPQFQENPLGTYNVTHVCVDTETKKIDEASRWTHFAVVAPRA